MMKRVLSASLLLLSLCLAACVSAGGGALNDAPSAGTFESGSATEYIVTATDLPVWWEYDNRIGNGQDNLCETEDAYYFSPASGAYLYYFDKANGSSGVLCGRPECVHDEEEQNVSCSGCLQLYGSTLNFFNGKLYYCAYDNSERCSALFCINLDGTDRRLVCDLKECDYFNLGGIQRLDYHRGKLYGYGIYQHVTDAVPESGMNVMCIDPETGEAKVLHTYQGNLMPIVKFYYYDRYVYFCAVKSNNDEGSEVEIMRWDTEGEALETVFVGDGLDGSMFAISVISENRIMLAPAGVPEGAPQSVYAVSDEQIIKVFDFELWGGTFLLEDAVVCIYPKGERMEVRGFDGDLIYMGDMGAEFTSAVGSGVKIIGVSSAYGDSNELFISYRMQDTQDPERGFCACLVRYDMTLEHPQGELLVFSPWA